MIGNLLICGIGVNLRVGSNSFSSLNLNVEPEGDSEAILEGA